MANNSLEDKNVKMLLVVVVVGLVIYLLVSYINGSGICGSKTNEGFHSRGSKYPNVFNKEGFDMEGRETSDNAGGAGVNYNDDSNLNFGDVNNDNGNNGNGNNGNGNNRNNNPEVDSEEMFEGFENHNPVAADPNSGVNEEVSPSNASSNTNAPAECYPKDVLSSQDLLPADANSKWAQANPNGQGSLQDKNFLNAGYHVGVNTVGQSLRNANRQLRSDPPNPQVKVSPWMQTTIEPDINRKPMEIGA